MSKKFVRKLIDVEIKLGFLHIPVAGIEMMPDIRIGDVSKGDTPR